MHCCEECLFIYNTSFIGGCHEGLGYSQEITFFSSGLLYDVEEGILHDEIGQFKKFFLQEECSEISIISMLATMMIYMMIYRSVSSIWSSSLF